MSKENIHPSAIVSPSAKLGDGVEIGPYSIVGDNVELGNNCVVMHHSVIDKNTKIGPGTKIYPFSSIGTDPQDITFKDEETFVEIGSNNLIREFTTINRGTEKGGGLTKIGDNNYFLAYAHIAHDCQIGNNTLFINGATLAGHVEVEDFAYIGAFSSVHQFVRIGRNSYIGAYTIVEQDILPFLKISQSRDSFNFYGTNSIGMLRSGIERPFINNVNDILNIIYKGDMNTSQAVEKLEQIYEDSPEVQIIVEFLSKTKRGILKNFKFGK
ncbi:MAG: acyl-ACP--UDP-N-acetylglucosamine O-acyltransferase [Acidobacteriota bacterium]